MGLIVSPIKSDKLEDWKKMTKSLLGEKSHEFKEFNKKYGLTRHDVWLVESPNGPLAVVLHEGPGADTIMQKVATSHDSFDVMFKEKLEEFHGMKFDGPPPGPMPVKMV